MSLQELEVLYCFCGHSEEQHFYDGETAKTGCEAGHPSNDGRQCRCEDFSPVFPPIEDYEPPCYRCGRDGVNCECVKGFAHDERDLY